MKAVTTRRGGRQLAGMTDGTDTLSFAYNEKGLRTEKTVNNVTREYVWNGSQLMADIGPNDVDLKTGLHRRLHTSLYYELVINTLKNAVSMGNGNPALERACIVSALEEIRVELELITQLCPY